MFPKVLTLTPSLKGLPAGLTVEQWRAAVEGAAREWSYAPGGCTSLEVRTNAPLSRRVLADDGENVIVFRQERWCHNERCSAESAFPARVMAATSTYPIGAKGPAIVGGDIELNAVNFHFKLKGPAEGPWHEPTVSLHSVLVHEIGHLLGFEDACGAADAWHAPPLEACAAEAQESVMFAPALHEHLSPADIARVCQAFPLSPDGPPAGDAGAAESQPAGPSSVWGASALLLAAVAVAVYRAHR